MQFIYVEPQTEFERLIGGFHYINANGKIEAGDDEAFRKFLEIAAPPNLAIIYIDSAGGDVDAAIGIAKLIRQYGYSTSIGCYRIIDNRFSIVRRDLTAGVCFSAATIAYLGGRLRYFPNGSRFGVHQFSYKNPSPENTSQSQMLSAKIARLLSEFEISLELLEISSSTPGNEIREIQLEQLQRLRVVTGGVTEAKWSVQARGEMLYVRGERDSLFGHHKVMLAFMNTVGFHFWAVIEAQGRERELEANSIVEIVVNEEDIRIDISDRCIRTTINGYVNILSKLTAVEARLIAFSDSFGVQVRTSKSAEIFLGVAAISTDGGREQLATLFNCLSS